MLRLAGFAVFPVLAQLGLFGEVDVATSVALAALSLIATAVELLGNAQGRKRKPSCLCCALIGVFLYSTQAGVLLYPHVARVSGALAASHHANSAQQGDSSALQPPGAAQLPQAAPPATRSGGQPLLHKGRKHGQRDEEKKKKKQAQARDPAHPPAKPAGSPPAVAGPVATLPPVDFSRPFGGELASNAKREMRTMSIVLPCAEERSNALNTVDRFCQRTPEDQLAEIIVVDDGSEPPLKKLFADDQRRLDTNPRCKVRFVRHEITIGLMAAKLSGGKVATGDVIAFFDCHCSPNEGWHREILDQVSENPRRMVVPAITDLDLDTFNEKKDSSVNAKCYLTFDADFKWFDDESDFIPTISGGLVAMGKDWFNLTGGFDEEMHGWGGENLDQSLRAWLCGGEITRAKSSRVAHMWRTGDPRTMSRYRVRAKPTNNRGRVAAAWFDAFLPAYRGGRVPETSVRNYDGIKARLGCRPFSYFVYRFRKVYIEGGVIAKKVFGLQDKASGLCLAKGFGATGVKECNEKNREQQLQLGNVDRETGSCCSGIRGYGGNDCLDYFDGRGPHWYSCDVTGQNGNQQYRITPEGRIQRGSDQCLYVDAKSKKAQVKKTRCSELAPGQGIFEQVNAFEPKEYKIYLSELSRHRFAEELPGLPDN